MVCHFQDMQHYWVCYVCSPKNMVSFILKTGFARIRTCNIIIWPKMAQNCKNLHATVPKSEILILNLNVLPKTGHATLCAFSWHARMHKGMTCNMLIKKWKKSRCQIWQNVIILLSFCYHLADGCTSWSFAWHHLACDARRLQKPLVEIWQMLSFCYHCY